MGNDGCKLVFITFRRQYNSKNDKKKEKHSSSFSPITRQIMLLYRAFHIFGQSKLGYDGLVLGSSHFYYYQQPQKMTLLIR